MAKPLESFKWRLESAMKARKLEPADLARASGVAPSQLSYYLKGKRDPESGTLRKLAIALGVSVDYLLSVEISQEESDRRARLDKDRLDAIRLVIDAKDVDIGSVLIGLRGALGSAIADDKGQSIPS